ncbi:unnamed protein product [Prunus armeniaca]
MKKKYQGTTKVKYAQLQALRKEFEMLNMKVGELVDEYFGRTLIVANKRRINGEKLEDVAQSSSTRTTDEWPCNGRTSIEGGHAKDLPCNITTQKTKRSFAVAFPQVDCGHFHGKAEGQIPPPPKLFSTRGGTSAPSCASVGLTMARIKRNGVGLRRSHGTGVGLFCLF